MTKTAIDTLIEGIDSKNISAVAEAFPVAIKEHVLRLIEAASKGAFGVEVEGDGKSDADGEDEDDDGDKSKDKEKKDEDDDCDCDDKKKNEAFEPGAKGSFDLAKFNAAATAAVGIKVNFRKSSGTKTMIVWTYDKFTNPKNLPVASKVEAVLKKMGVSFKADKDNGYDSEEDEVFLGYDVGVTIS